MRVKQGVLLAGGHGTRLLPKNRPFSKNLYPVLDQLVIDHSIEAIKQTGIEDLIITIGGEFFSGIVDYVGDGSKYGLNVCYCHQPKANGIAAAINLVKPFLKSTRFAVILGDNMFFEPIQYDQYARKAEIFLQQVSPNNPKFKDFGIATLNNNKIINIQEKPQFLPEDNQENQFGIITGFYIFNELFFEYFKELTPSLRGEFEVVDIINKYLMNNQLSYSFIKGEWSDMGRVENIEKVREILRNNQCGS